MASAYIKAALLTLAITLLGFFFITQLDAMRANELRASVNDLLFQSESERMLYQYATVMGNSTTELCGYLLDTTPEKASKAYALSEQISYYEKSNVVNADYESIKGQYYLANAELYLNIRAAAKYCGSAPYTTVLFFYNATTDCPSCRAQGGVLDNLRKTHPELQVFAFPADSNYDFVNIFARRANVTQVPALVINDRTVLMGLQSESQVEPYLLNSS